MTKRRTNTELAADILAMCLRHGIIDRTDDTRFRIQHIFGLDRYDLAPAIQRTEGMARYPLTKQIGDDPTLNEPPVKATRRGGKAPRAAEMIDGVLHLHCSGHEAGEPHWAPASLFDLRTDRPGVRKSKCVKCWPMYQKQQRLTRDAKRALKAASMFPEYDGEGRVLGIMCVVCGRTVECDCHEGEAS